MPVYEYQCLKCGKKFELRMTMREYEEKRICCPKCGSRRVARRISSFFAQTSKKS